MDYSSLRTAAEIINTFRECQNAGEQIDLFEALATSDEPPIEAFVEILRNVKLEAVVALTIQAFGKITDVDIRERLKQSDDLLAILSEQAQSGKTDLIRWSAAITIENLGFDFIAVSRHLTVEPKSIADRIMQANLKRFEDKNLLSSNNFDEYLNFWIYGNLNELKIKTASMSYGQDSKYEEVIARIFSALVFKAIREVNQSLQRAESMGSSALVVDENELFEFAACQEAYSQIINSSVRQDNISILLRIHVHCLQSNNYKIRKIAADNLSKIDNHLLDNYKKYYPNILIAMSLFQENFTSIAYSSNSTSYKILKNLTDKLKIILPDLNRKAVKNDCQLSFNKILDQMNQRMEKFQITEKAMQNLKSKFDQLQKIKDINHKVYETIILKYYFNNLNFPILNIEENEDEALRIFSIHINTLEQSFSYLRIQVNKFYEDYKQKQLSPFKSVIKQKKENVKSIESFLGIFFSITKIVTLIASLIVSARILMIFVDFVLAIVVAFAIVICILIVFNFFTIDIFWEITFFLRKRLLASAEKSLHLTKEKYSYEQHRLDDEKQKILNLLSI